MAGELILHCGFALTTALCGKVSVSYDDSHEPHFDSDKKSSQYFFNSHLRTHLSTVGLIRLHLSFAEAFYVTCQNKIAMLLQSLLRIS